MLYSEHSPHTVELNWLLALFDARHADRPSDSVLLCKLVQRTEDYREGLT